MLLPIGSEAYRVVYSRNSTEQSNKVLVEREKGKREKKTIKITIHVY